MTVSSPNLNSLIIGFTLLSFSFRFYLLSILGSRLVG
jgi:hypothetical protein